MYILVLLLTAYFVFLIYSLVPPLESETSNNFNTLDGLTVLIPFRDEEENLPRLIESLETADFSFPVEFIFIDDHSEDGSALIVQDFEKASLIPSGQAGKKFAIKEGIKKANYPWILTLDADVRVSSDFISALDGLNLAEAKMFLFALSPTRRKGIAAAFFDLEFIALQAIGIGMAQKGKPILSNGACLLFQKEAFEEADQKREDYHIPTGDDIFGMFAIAREFGVKSIQVASSEPLVSVSFPQKVRALFDQRVRWISKTIDVPDTRYKTLAFLMGIIHLLPLTVVVSLTLGLSWPDAVSLLFIKWAGEWIFFWSTTKSYNRKDLLLSVPVSQILYPIYTFALIVSGIYQKFQFKKSTLNAAR